MYNEILKGRSLIKSIKDFFIKSEKEAYHPNPPGRTFKRVLTGVYFGCENKTSDIAKIAQAKKDKIDHIRELELTPMNVTYTYKNIREQTDDKQIVSAYVAFQKEVFAEKWNMIHVTEVSFTIYSDDFDEFEQMSGVNLTHDFRDVTPKSDTSMNQASERRKNKRDK